MSFDNHQQYAPLSPKCIATTGDAFRSPTERQLKPKGFTGSGQEANKRSNLFRATHFSPDGTTIIAHSEDQNLRSFVLPYDTIGARDEPAELQTYSQFTASSNIQSFDIHPQFNIQNAASTLVLCGSADVPITLRNVLDFDTPQASYPFENPTTEEHRSPRSLTFTLDGNHFVAGSFNHLAVFDTNQKIKEPISSLNLRPRRGTLQVDSWSFTRKAIVCALNISNDELLAAGTLEREVGIYKAQGLGSCNLTFSIWDGAGTGVTGLKWSPCGRYLIVAERQSDEIHVYDIRDTQQKVSTLVGRKAKTSQKLGIDVIHTPTGYEVWAGGVDGRVRMWSDPGSQEGMQMPNDEVHLHDAPVSDISWDATGSVLATCSGEMYPVSNYDDDESSQEGGSDESEDGDSDDDSVDSGDGGGNGSFVPDNSLKVWTM